MEAVKGEITQETIDIIRKDIFTLENKINLGQDKEKSLDELNLIRDKYKEYLDEEDFSIDIKGNYI